MIFIYTFRLDLEDASCQRDRILVYPDFDADCSENPVHARCGYRNVEMLEASNNVVIVFQSDDIVSGRGFLANVNVLS